MTHPVNFTKELMSWMLLERKPTTHKMYFNTRSIIKGYIMFQLSFSFEVITQHCYTELTAWQSKCRCSSWPSHVSLQPKHVRWPEHTSPLTNSCQDREYPTSRTLCHPPRHPLALPSPAEKAPLDRLHRPLVILLLSYHIDAILTILLFTSHSPLAVARAILNI
ncbi:hypothetical protein R6Z07M_017051 [Ovis aries]